VSISEIFSCTDETTSLGYDSLLGITYFDVKKDSKRHEEAAVSAAREPASMTRLNSETSPVPASERSFVLITAVGLPMIDLSEVSLRCLDQSCHQPPLTTPL
jgi:hypothetical protein